MDRRDFLSGSGSILAGSALISLSKPLQAANKSSISSLKDKPLRKIAFGSCNRQGKSQRHWSVIKEDRPDLWLWLGDNIYADGTSINQRAKEYAKLKFNDYYYDFQKNIPIMGTWDDHDYSQNNQGASFKDKAQSQQLFANFMNIPDNHILRNREGIYHSETFGPSGQQTQIVMLDLRYFKQNPQEGSMLGEMQWLWLEQELRATTADLIIIGSSVHMTSGVSGLGLEGWVQYPEERERIFSIIESLDAPVLVITGDRHMAEFTHRSLSNGKPLYEFMSSGLTHSTGVALPDSGRIGNIVGSKNYGMIQIDWTSTGPKLALQIKDPLKQGVIAQTTPDFSY